MQKTIHPWQVLANCAACLIALLSASSACAVDSATGAASPASTPSAMPAPGESARIAAERAAAESKFVASRNECRTRFVVTSCIDAAKKERRQTLDALKARQLQVDETRRHAKTVQRRQELVEKAAEDAKRDATRGARRAGQAASSASDAASGASAADAASAAASGSRSRQAKLPKASPPRPSASRPSPPPVKSDAERREQETRSRAAFEARQRSATEHRDAAATAAIRRMSHKPPSAALPVPSQASSVSGR